MGLRLAGPLLPAGSPSDYTVTFDPSSPLGNLKTISVSVSASDLAGIATSEGFSFRLRRQGVQPGILRMMMMVVVMVLRTQRKIYLGTSGTTKTIFVRPKKCTQLNAGRECINWVYWSEFVEVLFPHASKAGFADIYAFTDAGIEVVVIGAQTPYLPMAGFFIRPRCFDEES